MSTESTDKHANGSDKASGCSVSPREVESAIEDLANLGEYATARGHSPAAVAHAFVWLGHTQASNLGCAGDVFDMHTEQMFETGDLYECAKCHAISSKETGAADDQAMVCDWCYDTEPTDKGAA